MGLLDPDPWLDYTLAVCVECDGNAATLQRTVDQQEVTVGVLPLAEEGIDHPAAVGVPGALAGACAADCSARR